VWSERSAAIRAISLRQTNQADDQQRDDDDDGADREGAHRIVQGNEHQDDDQEDQDQIPGVRGTEHPERRALQQTLDRVDPGPADRPEERHERADTGLVGGVREQQHRQRPGPPSTS
jgi:hypothetical protein